MSAPRPQDDPVLEKEQDHANHLQQQQPVHFPSVYAGFTVPHASAPRPPPVSSPRNTPNRQLAPPRLTDHTYQDYAQLTPSPYDFPRTKKSSSNFPAKLHRMISDPANARAIQWQSHGRAWKILDKELLVDVVIPKYFGQSKFESFTRQLSGWGFVRMHQTGPDYRCYYHECFLRGLPDLTRMMKRVEPNQGKLLPNVEAEPNFYEMDLLDPLTTVPLHSHASDGEPPVNNHDYQAGAEGAAGAGAVGYPYPHHGGPPPNWPPNNVPPYMPPHPYEHYPGHGFPLLPPPPPPPGGNFPPPPYPHHHNPHAYPYLHMPPPYHGGYPAGAAAAMPPQPQPAYASYQPPRYPNPHDMHMHHPNQYYNQEAPQPQPQHPNYYDAYRNQHARDYDEHDALSDGN